MHPEQVSHPGGDRGPVQAGLRRERRDVCLAVAQNPLVKQLVDLGELGKGIGQGACLTYLNRVLRNYWNESLRFIGRNTLHHFVVNAFCPIVAHLCVPVRVGGSCLQLDDTGGIWCAAYSRPQDYLRRTPAEHRAPCPDLAGAPQENDVQFVETFTRSLVVLGFSAMASVLIAQAAQEEFPTRSAAAVRSSVTLAGATGPAVRPQPDIIWH
ncbi:hypothetical protein ACH4ZU_04745 [Streptomyces sp. NPDC020472]|uniref:hypothetical protein n=1 Tax=Streptomyces sp. NPDC020472 TaxID=3365075 RepID=UPI0037B9B8EB